MILDYEMLFKELENTFAKNMGNMFSELEKNFKDIEEKNKTNIQKDEDIKTPVKDGKIDLSEFETVSSISNEPVYSNCLRTSHGYCGSNILIVINNHVLSIVDNIIINSDRFQPITTINNFTLRSNKSNKEKLEENTEEKIDTRVVLSTVVLPNTDKEIDLIKNLNNGTIEEFLINEYGQYMYRKIKNVTYKGQSNTYGVETLTLKNNYMLKSDKEPGSYRTITKEEFINKESSFIKE